jgi:excisionase family DNA binding protein
MDRANELLTVPEAAALLRFKVSTIRAWVCQRCIPYVKLGRLVRIRRSDLEALIAGSSSICPRRKHKWGADMSEREQETKTRQKHALASLRELLEKHFYKPDWQATRIVLGTIQAHYLKIGDPAWLFVVAPPGAGKTTMSIMGASGMDQVILLSDVSENTFLSGFYGHHQPGLLEKIGETKTEGTTHTASGDLIILVKDFTTVLSMRREKRGAILSQLREMHDGMYKRDFGTGETKVWQGRATVVAAVTPVLDRHYSIFTALGERFLQVRWHRPDSEDAGEWAIRQQGQETAIREQMSKAVSAIFKNAPAQPPTLSPEMCKRIAALAEVVALGRTHVFRNGYGNREIEYVPEAEANTRISKQLAAIARGVASLNGRNTVTEEEFEDLRRVAFDCLPDARRRLLETFIRGEQPSTVSMAPTVKSRELEELQALGILESEALPMPELHGGESNPRWHLTARVRQLLTASGCLGAGSSCSRSVRDGAIPESLRDGEISDRHYGRENTSGTCSQGEGGLPVET